MNYAAQKVRILNRVIAGPVVVCEYKCVVALTMQLRFLEVVVVMMRGRIKQTRPTLFLFKSLEDEENRVCDMICEAVVSLPKSKDLHCPSHQSSAASLPSGKMLCPAMRPRYSLQCDVIDVRFRFGFACGRSAAAWEQVR